LSLALTHVPDLDDQNDAAVLVMSIETDRVALRRALEGCRTKPKPRRVHALRVATRRLQSALELAAVVGAKPDLRLRRQLNELLPTLSPLRDSHVARQTVEGLAASTPALDSLLELFARREHRLERQVVARLSAFDVVEFERGVSALTSRLRELFAPDTSRPALAAALRGALAERHLEVERRRRRANAERPKSLHRLRLTLKSYRYALDALAAALPLPREGQQASQVLAQLQDQLGGAHDAHLLAETARLWAKKRHKLRRLAQTLQQTSDAAQRAGAEAAAQARLAWPLAHEKATPESLR